MRRLVPPVLLVALLLAEAWWAASTTSGTFDETTYLRLGAEIVRHGNVQPCIDLGVAPLPVLMAALGPRALGVSAPPTDGTYRQQIALSRASMVLLVAVPLLLLVYAWLARFGGWETATAGGALLVLSPNMVAYLSVAATDGCFVLATLLVLAALVHYAGARSGAAGVWLGVALGLALATKYTAVLLFVVAALTLVSLPRRDGASASVHFRGTLVSLAWVSLLALGIAWACHGFATAQAVTSAFAPEYARWFGTGPIAEHGWAALERGWLPAPVRGLIVQVNHDRAGHDAFLLGQRSSAGWWYYAPLALAIKSTPVEVVLLVAAACILCTRGRRIPVPMRVWQLAGAVIVVAATATRIDLGVRYVLVLYPLAIVVTLTFARTRCSQGVWRGGVAVLVVAQAWSAWSIAPRYLSYANMFAGGPARAVGYLADSNLDWGQDLPALAETLGRLGAKRVVLSYFGTAPVSAYGVHATAWKGWGLPEVAEADWVAISATHLDGLYVPDDPFAAFRLLTPSARAGYSLLLYSTDRADVRQAMGESPARHAQWPR
jgi:hypothetical protein